MKITLHLWATATIAFKRLLAQRGLALATLLGLVAAMSLTMSIPLYAEGVYYRILSAGLFSDTPRYRGQSLRPPLALLFRYTGSFTGPIQWPDITALDTYLSASEHTHGIYRDIQLPAAPHTPRARMFNTGIFGLFTQADAAIVTTKQPRYQVNLTTLTDIHNHITLLDGTLPADNPNPTGTFDILINTAIAEKMGVQIGEIYIAYDLRAMRKYADTPAKFEMRVAGIWTPSDPHAEFWDYVQIPRDNILLITENTFQNRISPALEDEVYQALWYLPLDAEQVYVSDVAGLLTRIRHIKKQIAHKLPHTILDVSPIKILERYQTAVNNLTVLLFAFSVPLISLLIAFIILIVTLTIERQRNQIAALRSRGATMSQVSGITALEALLQGLVALGLALPLSLLLAYTIGQARTFLDFSLANDIRVGLTWGSVRFGLLILGLTLCAQIIPTFGAARHTIVTYKHARARLLRPPGWQRAYLDVLLAVPALYGGYLLKQQGSILQETTVNNANPFQNPLLFLVPALSMLAITLLVLRVIPWLMRSLAWLSKLTRSVGFLLASRQLARTPSLYAAPLALLILTLSLATYTASLAATLDKHLYDQQHYRVGADVSLVDTGDAIAAGERLAPGPPPDIANWQFLPVSEYQKLPDIVAATRIGKYEARVKTATGYQPGTFIGVDRVDLVNVAFWRNDFSSESLGGLMNQLAITHDGILLPRSFMTAHLLNVGDSVHVNVHGYNRATVMTLKIVGSFDYFPTWYPDTGPLIVGNLDYFFQEAQGQYPYHVWLKTAPDADYERLASEVWDINMGAQAMLVAAQRIHTEQRHPERQGLLGLLSVGFSAATILTALGFMLYALFSFRRRAVEMGVLRASGLSTRHMAAFVGWELAFLLLTGGLVGTALGIWASNTFIPTLQVGAAMSAHIPPFAVAIAWPAIMRLYALFVGIFVIALAALVRSLVKMKLFQALKLGETI